MVCAALGGKRATDERVAVRPNFEPSNMSVYSAFSTDGVCYQNTVNATSVSRALSTS